MAGEVIGGAEGAVVFICPECLARFGLRGAWERHIRAFHGLVIMALDAEDVPPLPRYQWEMTEAQKEVADKGFEADIHDPVGDGRRWGDEDVI